MAELPVLADRSRGALAQLRFDGPKVAVHVVRTVRRHMTPPVLVALCVVTFLATLTLGWFLTE